MAETKEKNPVGRPPLFKTAKELQSKIDEYFDGIKGERGENEEGEPIWIVYPEPATITGLAFFLGFESRRSIYDYEASGEFSHTIKRARLKIENEYEKALTTSKNPTGSIFALKNFGWDDKKQVEHSGELSVPLIEWVQRKKE